MKTVIIIGAGPAGLTAAYEFLEQTDIVPIVLEASMDIGGLSKTVNYKGNRMDIGPHRFFSKSDRVMDWWVSFLPVEPAAGDLVVTYHNKHNPVKNRGKISPSDPDNVMLVRDRLTRIYFLKKFFNYPLKLSVATLKNLGLVRLIRIGTSYIRTKLFPIKNEVSLEDFFINRFGRELYLTFFKDYTEKVWGVPCNQISAEWGAQRIKGLSLKKTLLQAIFKNKKENNSIEQKGTETSLIEKFLYPKYGPGQLWELVADKVKKKGGQVLLGKKVSRINIEGNKVASVAVVDNNGHEELYKGNYFISTMPVKTLVQSFDCEVPAEIRKISDNLIYRDFIAVGLLVTKLKVKNKDGGPIKDNWIYIQEREVKLGRLQIYNNWSPAMVKKPGTFWIGLEYFCNEGDELWTMPDDEMMEFAKKEIDSIGIIDKADVLDGVVIRMPKTYPSYVGSYDNFDQVKHYLNGFENLFLVGRNGMHKYNNQDHSMLTAMQAVENIKNGITDKENIWAINTEEEYHEEK